MKVEHNPKLNFIPAANRKDGISAFMRIRNGASYLKPCILSVVNQVDEIICIYNNCQDATEDILIQLEKQYPEKIKVIHYVPVVYPPNSEGYLKEPENSPHCLAYYYNYALSKTTFSHVFKFDADEIFYNGILQKLKKYVGNNKFIIGLRGINLVDVNEKLYVRTQYPRTAGHDTFLFKYDPKFKFIKKNNCEYSPLIFPVEKVIDCFYHLKLCMPDRGFNNYDLHENPNSRYVKICTNFFKENLTPYENRDIFDLGFEFINNSQKSYNLPEFNILEKQFAQRISS